MKIMSEKKPLYFEKTKIVLGSSENVSIASDGLKGTNAGVIVGTAQKPNEETN